MLVNILLIVIILVLSAVCYVLYLIKESIVGLHVIMGSMEKSVKHEDVVNMFAKRAEKEPDSPYVNPKTGLYDSNYYKRNLRRGDK